MTQSEKSRGDNYAYPLKARQNLRERFLNVDAKQKFLDRPDKNEVVEELIDVGFEGEGVVTAND